MLKQISFYETKQARKSQYNVAMLVYVCNVYEYACMGVCKENDEVVLTYVCTYAWD